MKAHKVREILESVQDILEQVHRDEKEQDSLIRQAHESYQKSARNLVNYISLRSFDIRDLQRKLGNLGMSRLARAEAYVEASLKTTIFFLRRILGEKASFPTKYTVSFKRAEKLLARRTTALLGDAHGKRRLRIMVTMPPGAADDYQLVKEMIVSGMDCARINCAHDGPEEWLKMIENIQKAGKEVGRKVVISMDIGGPKIRTGDIATDLEGNFPLMLRSGDQLILCKQAITGEPALYDSAGKLVREARICCTLPEALDYAESGDPVFFDDGAIKGVIAEKHPDHLRIRIMDAREGGARLKADKGINFPDSNLKIRGLTEKDREDLKFIARYADVVNFSFVNSPEDVRDIITELDQLGVKDQLGIILKVETRHGYDNLAKILLEAMKTTRIGVMIARGDLAIEAGWKRMGSIQKEILTICNASHVPVVWATQVLEKLAKKGLPSRSEITDVVNATKAECVMLNKGPHILQAIQLLNQIIESSEDYQDKNAPMLPRLKKISKR